MNILTFENNLYIILDDLIYAFIEIPDSKLSFIVDIYRKDDWKLLDEFKINEWESKVLKETLMRGRGSARVLRSLVGLI